MENDGKRWGESGEKQVEKLAIDRLAVERPFHSPATFVAITSKLADRIVSSSSVRVVNALLLLLPSICSSVSISISISISNSVCLYLVFALVLRKTGRKKS